MSTWGTAHWKPLERVGPFPNKKKKPSVCHIAGRSIRFIKLLREPAIKCARLPLGARGDI